MDEQTYTTELNACVEALHREFAKFRVGRARVDLIENVSVSAYGSTMPLKQVASISIPEPRSLLVAPWDKSLTSAIEQAIRNAELGLQAVVDGEQIHVTIPALTEERRRDLVKLVNQEAEKARVCVRHVREDAMKAIDRKEESGEISEDDKFREREEAQGAIEKTNNTIEEARVAKESDITTV